MRIAFAALIALCIGCGEGPMPELDERVKQYVLDRYADELPDHGPVAFVHETWYFDQQCLRYPWTPEHPESCIRGRAWAAGPAACWIEVVWRDYSTCYADTSFAHELLHCWFWRDFGDPDHSHAAWGKNPHNPDAVLHQVNRELRELGW